MRSCTRGRTRSGRLIISDQPNDPAARPIPGPSAPASRRSRTTQSLSSPRGAITSDLITRTRREAGAQSRLRPRRDPGGIGVQPARALAEGRDGADAADAVDGGADYRVTDAYDPAQNIRAGVAYLKSLMTRFNDDVVARARGLQRGPRRGREVRQRGAALQRDAQLRRAHHRQQRRPRRPRQTECSAPSRSSTASRSSATRTSRPPTTRSSSRPTASNRPPAHSFPAATICGLAASYAISVTDVCLSAPRTRTTSCR